MVSCGNHEDAAEQERLCADEFALAVLFAESGRCHWRVMM